MSKVGWLWLATIACARPASTLSNASSPASARVHASTDSLGAALARIAELGADETCRPPGKDQNDVPVTSNSWMDIHSMLNAYTIERDSDDAEANLERHLDACWVDRIHWEDERGLRCHDIPNPPRERPQPECHPMPAAATTPVIEPWWTQGSPCGGEPKMKLVTAANPMVPGALMFAVCDDGYKIKRATYWHLNGVPRADGGGQDDGEREWTFWYPNGALSAKVIPGYESTWTYYALDGTVARRGTRTNWLDPLKPAKDARP